MKKNVDLIIFDLDGTLIDSKVDIISSVNHMLRALGLNQRNPVEIMGFIGKGVRQLIIDSLGERDLDKAPQAIKIYKDIYRVHMFDTTTLYPGVREALEYFKNAKKVIMSNKSVEFTQVALERFGIEKYFLKVFGGDDENCRKPSACPLINVMREFSVQPKRAIIVGDSNLDIQAGRNAGILTCGVTYGIGKKEDVVTEKPDFIIDNIGRLKDILE
jgi:phosphoglycolate phosphatase